VDVRSGRCKSCNDSHIRCDLRVTFKEFEKLAATRARLSKAADEAEDELEDAEKEAARLISAAHELVAKARMKARRKRKELRFAENKEDGSYQRELAAIEAVRAMEQEASAASSSVPSVDDLLASSELLDFPDLGDFDAATMVAPPFAWGQMTGSVFPLDTGLSESST
jgi:midasin (ATPase involved in ribosome maturation)